MAWSMNPQQMAHSNKSSMGQKGSIHNEGARAEPMGGEGSAIGQGEHTQLHDHGDGTFHSITSDGTKTEHPHIGHALVHIGAHHAGGQHMHIHHDGAQATSHHAGEDGQVEGPHKHADINALKEHLGKFFGEEQQEGEDGAPVHMPSHESGMTGLE